jgi:hypothetical protein
MLSLAITSHNAPWNLTILTNNQLVLAKRPGKGYLVPSQEKLAHLPPLDMAGNISKNATMVKFHGK